MPAATLYNLPRSAELFGGVASTTREPPEKEAPCRVC